MENAHSNRTVAIVISTKSSAFCFKQVRTSRQARPHLPNVPQLSHPLSRPSTALKQARYWESDFEYGFVPVKRCAALLACSSSVPNREHVLGTIFIEFQEGEPCFRDGGIRQSMNNPKEEALEVSRFGHACQHRVVIRLPASLDNLKRTVAVTGSIADQIKEIRL